MVWFYFLHRKNPNLLQETYFPNNQFDWSVYIEENFQIINDEIVPYLNNNENVLKPYFSTSLMNEFKKWKTFSFYFWGQPVSKHAINSCPNTISILEKIPHIVSASVSILEPNAEIKPHYGDTNAIYRCHLPLVVPSSLPHCGFRVGYEDRAWENGKLLIFNDAAYHKAWNYTNQRRVILLFDVLKPEYAGRKKWICALVRGNIIWQIVSKPFFKLNKSKNFFTKSMCLFFAWLIYFWLSFSKRKSVWL